LNGKSINVPTENRCKLLDAQQIIRCSASSDEKLLLQPQKTEGQITSNLIFHY